MGVRGIDISEWQAGMDTERVCRENGITFAMVRTNYGSNHDDLQFHRFCDGLDRAGVLVTPYVYPLASDTNGSIDDAVRIIGGRYNRMSIDWEEGSGGGQHLRWAHERAWEHGFNTPLVYDPSWYWQKQGSPNVDWMGQSGRIAGRWKSWYPDNVPGGFDWILSKIPSHVWNDNRGGIPTQVIQFTSSGRLSGWNANLDLNYYRGTRAELEALLGGEGMQPTDSIKLVAPEDPSYSETHPLDWALAQAFYKGSDAYKEIMGVGDNPGLVAKVQTLLEENAALKEKLAQIETGGVSEERIAQIAKKALGQDLLDDEQ